MKQNVETKVRALNEEVINLQADVQSMDTQVQELKTDHQGDIGRLEREVEGLKKATAGQEEPMTDMKVF